MALWATGPKYTLGLTKVREPSDRLRSCAKNLVTVPTVRYGNRVLSTPLGISLMMIYLQIQIIEES